MHNRNDYSVLQVASIYRDLIPMRMTRKPDRAVYVVGLPAILRAHKRNNPQIVKHQRVLKGN